jgi:WD40 repeat protein
MLATTTGTPDQTIALWEVPTGQLLHHLVVPNEAHFSGKSFSPKGDMLAAVDGGSIIQIWNPKTGE